MYSKRTCNYAHNPTVPPGQTVPAGSSAAVEYFALNQGEGFSLAGGTDVTLPAGYHLVLYSLACVSTSPGVNTRSEQQGWLRLGGVDSPYGRISNYMRHLGENCYEAFAIGATILHFSSPTTLQVRVSRTDSSGTAAVVLAGPANGAFNPDAWSNGLHCAHLQDSWPYLRARHTSGGVAFPTSTPVVVPWETTDELASSDYSLSGSDITLKTPGVYLVCCNVGVANSGSGASDRGVAQLQVMLDGVELPGARTCAYLRGADSCQNGAAAWYGLVRTTSSNQVLSFRMSDVSTPALGKLSTVADEGTVTIAKLPADASCISLVDSAGGQDVDTAAFMGYATTDFSQGTKLSYVSPGAVRVNDNGPVLLLGSQFVQRTDAVSNARQNPAWFFVKNRRNLDVSGNEMWDELFRTMYGGAYMRGAVTAQPPGALVCGGPHGLVDGLAVNYDSYHVRKADFSSYTDATTTFPANRGRLDVVYLGDILQDEANVHVLLPDSDLLTEWDGATPHFSKVNSGAGYPARTPDNTAVLGDAQGAGTTHTDRYTLTDVLAGVTNPRLVIVRVWVFHSSTPLGDETLLQTTLRVGATLWAQGNVLLVSVGSLIAEYFEYQIYAYPGGAHAALTETDINDLRCEVLKTINDIVATVKLSDVRVEVYTIRPTLELDPEICVDGVFDRQLEVAGMIRKCDD
jgi:hypothetical protein